MISGLTNLFSPRITFLKEVVLLLLGLRCRLGRVNMSDLNVAATSYALLECETNCWNARRPSP